MQSKVDRIRNGPGIFEILFGTVLSVALGALLGMAHMITQPAEKITKAPETPERGQIYYFEGERSSTDKARLDRKMKLIADEVSGTYSLTEQELNNWAAATFVQEKKKKDPKAEKPSLLLEPGTLNFHIMDDSLQIALPMTLSLFGVEGSNVGLATGRFVSTDRGVRFVPDQMSIGNLRIERLPYLGDYIMKRLVAAHHTNTGADASWNRIESIAIREGALKVTLP